MYEIVKEPLLMRGSADFRYILSHLPDSSISLESLPDLAPSTRWAGLPRFHRADPSTSLDENYGNNYLITPNT
jgi:hypothetical protein